MYFTQPACRIVRRPNRGINANGNGHRRNPPSTGNEAKEELGQDHKHEGFRTGCFMAWFLKCLVREPEGDPSSNRYEWVWSHLSLIDHIQSALK